MKKLSTRPLGLFAAIGLFVTMAAFGAASESEFIQTGYASWYGGKFQGRQTASGEIFDTNKLTAAHKRLPFGTHVEVTNLANGKSVVVRINDRGPFVEGRIIDLSRAAAVRIGMLGSGVAEVQIRVVDPHNGQGPKQGQAPAPDHSPGRAPEPEESGSPRRSGPEPEIDEESGLPLPSLPDEPREARGDRTETGGHGAGKSGSKTGAETVSEPVDPRDNPIYTFPEPKSYTIQIASFSRRDNAARLYRSLEKAGLSPSYEKSGAGHYRVVLAEVDPDRVERVKERLAELGHSSVLVRENL